MEKITPEQLKEFNGSNGVAYVAYRGKVYDVSDSYLWEDGMHQDQHEAGMDLTQTMDAEAPHDADVLKAFPVVGELVADSNLEEEGSSNPGSES